MGFNLRPEEMRKFEPRVGKIAGREENLILACVLCCDAFVTVLTLLVRLGYQSGLSTVSEFVFPLNHVLSYAFRF